MSRDLFDEVLNERKFLTKRTLFKNNESRTPGPSFLIHHPVSGRHEFVGLTPELFVIERERERGTNDYRVSGRRRIDSRCWARDRISSIRKISMSGEEARAEAKIVSMIYLTTVSPVRSKKLARTAALKLRLRQPKYTPAILASLRLLTNHSNASSSNPNRSNGDWI